MPDLALERLGKRYGDIVAVDAIDLDVPDGTFVCLLGPSGCGKTTLLRLIAGLETPSSGRVLLGGEDLAGVPVHRRELGMVFQSLALFPHLSVGENIAYALRIRRRPRAEREARVAELLELVRLSGLAHRPVAELSGGQRQRVAIARALAVHPRLFLLDEPLSALDAKLREAMQVELRELQRALGVTTVVVTHDQREAMTMADIVVVMGEGRVHQAAAPVEVYRRPADAFVADFIGQTNLLPARRGGDGLEVLGRPLRGADGPAAYPDGKPERPAADADRSGGDGVGGTRDGGHLLSVRPEDVRLAAPGHGSLEGRVRFVRDLGATVETFVDVDGHEIVAIAPPRERGAFAVGDRVGLAFDVERAVLLAR